MCTHFWIVGWLFYPTKTMECSETKVSFFFNLSTARRLFYGTRVKSRRKTRVKRRRKTRVWRRWKPLGSRLSKTLQNVFQSIAVGCLWGNLQGGFCVLISCRITLMPSEIDFGLRDPSPPSNIYGEALFFTCTPIVVNMTLFSCQ